MRTRTAALIYLVLGLAVFGRALLPGQLFVPMHTQRLEPWRSDLTPEQSAELAQGEYTAQSDKLISFRADDEITVDALRHGRLPLWNPSNAGGVPHLAQGLYGVFYPPHWLYLLLGPQHAYGWLALFHHVLAALFMFLWLKKLGTGEAGALIGGLAFSFSGTLLDRAHYYQYIETVTWLPLGLLCIEQWFEGRRAALFALAPIAALVLLVAWPQIAAFVLNAWAIVALVKSLRHDLRTRTRLVLGAACLSIGLWTAVLPLIDRPIALAFWPHVALLFVFIAGPGRKAALDPSVHPRRAFLARMGAFGAVLLLGAAIAAIQYLPAAEWTAHGTRQLGGAPEKQAEYGLRPTYALATLLPNVFGPPDWQLAEDNFNLTRMYGLNTADQVIRRGAYGNPVENATYVGIATLALALLGIVGARRARWPLFACLVVFGGIAYGVAWITYPTFFLFPGFQISSDSRRALVLVAPMLAAFAAFGVKFIAERPSVGRAAAALLFALGAAMLAMRWWMPDATLLEPLLRHAAYLGGLFQLSGDVPEHARAEVVALIRHSLETAGIVAALSGVALVVAARTQRERVFAFPLLLVLAADLLVYAWPRTASQPAEGFLAGHALIERVRETNGPDGRFAHYRPPEMPEALTAITLPPNLAGCYGLRDAWCYTVSLPKAWVALADAGFTPGVNAGVGFLPLSTEQQLESRALDVMGVRSIVGTGEPPAALPPGITLDARFGRSFVLKNERALPRASLIASATPFDSASDWAVCARAVLETREADRPLRLGSPAAPVRDVPALADVDGTLPTARVIDDTPERVRVELEGGTRDSWLLLRDGYAPGWQATIDGKEAQVVPGDLAFRAVLVPAGAREVVFSYAPTSVLLGKFISLGALVLAGLLLVRSHRRSP